MTKATQALASRHRLSLDDVKPAMAKVETLAVLKKEDAEKRRDFGQILARACELAGLGDKEAAARLGVDQSQFSRWLLGKENAAVWKFTEDERLGPAFLIAQAEARHGKDADITIEHVIKVRRKVIA